MLTDTVDVRIFLKMEASVLQGLTHRKLVNVAGVFVFSVLECESVRQSDCLPVCPSVRRSVCLYDDS